jgi:translation initiation factor 2 subunit 1
MKEGELVICRIEKIDAHSALAKIINTDRYGIIHASEVASGWVRRISDYLKEGQLVVCKILSANKTLLNLSIKRVSENEKKQIMKKYEADKKADKIINFVAKKMKAENSEEIKKKIIEKFGSLSSFIEAIKEGKSEIEEFDKKWIRMIKKILEKIEKKKEYEFKAKIKLRSYEPNGIEIIKSVFEDDFGLEIKYIGNSEFLLKFKSENPKIGEKEFKNRVDKLIEKSKRLNCFVEANILS